MDDTEERVIPIELGGKRGQGVFHPSEVCKEGVCERALAYELAYAPKAAEKIDSRLRRIFHNGHAVHARLQYVIGEAIKPVGGEFDAEIRLPPSDLHVSGTTDGGMVIKGWPYLLEIKSMSKKGYTELGARPWDEHYDQVNIYMRLSKVNAAIVLIECKDNQDLREYFVRFDAARWNRIELLCRRVINFLAAGELPPQITTSNGCTGQKCAFHRVCKGDLTSWTPEKYGRS